MVNSAKEENVLGRTIRELRKEKKMSLDTFSKALNLSTSYLSEIERGLKTPGSEIIFSLREEFGVDLNAIVDKNSAKADIVVSEPSATYNPGDKVTLSNFAAHVIAELEESSFSKDAKIQIAQAMIRMLNQRAEEIDQQLEDKKGAGQEDDQA